MTHFLLYMTASFNRVLLGLALALLAVGVVALPAHANTTIFSDSFTDTNGTNLTTHNSNWTAYDVNDDSSATATIEGNRLQAGINGENADIFLPSSMSAVDSCVSTDILFPGGTGDAYHELYLRRTLNNNNPNSTISTYFTYINYADHTVGLGWYVSSSGADNQSYGVDPWPSDGWHTFKMCAIGNELTTYIDTTVVNSRTDSGNHVPNAGSAALRLHGETGPSIDNFLYEAIDTPVAPVLGAITVSPNPVEINQSVTASASFTDANTADTHTATVDWGDTTGSCMVSESGGSGTITCTRSGGYSATGVYAPSITVTDNTSRSDTESYQYLAVYNPTPQGMFSAARLFLNPSGAYPTTVGTVKFGVSARYSGAQAVGNFKIDFDAANLHFESTSVQSLVTTTTKATFRGGGSLNGISGYTFLVTGLDEASPNPGEARIQIKDSSGTVVYDSQSGAGDTADPTTTVTGQVIVN